MIAESVLRAATALLSPAGAGARLSTFIFHRVLAQPDPLLPGRIDARRFDELLGWIAGQFNVLAPRDACERLQAGRLPPRAALISFDDGYADNHDVALPLLRRRGMRAAFFVATGFLDGGTMFNDRVVEAVRLAPGPDVDAGWLGLGRLPVADAGARRVTIRRLLDAVKYRSQPERDEAVVRLEALCAGRAPTDLMMTSAQVRALHDAGMEIGGHTRTHPILRVLDDADAQREIRLGAEELRAITGSMPLLFAYPNGKPGQDFDDRHPPMVEAAGFHYAFTTVPGAARAATDRFRLPRFTPWDRSTVRFQARMLRNLRLAEPA